MGRIGLLNSGGASDRSDDLSEAVRTAVINERSGGTGLILGRKAFRRPLDEVSRSSAPSMTSNSTDRSRSPEGA
jgi:DhnA family fructose-bisphosphate aldolase class Ia